MGRPRLDDPGSGRRRRLSLAVRGADGLAVGGDFTAPTAGADASAYSSDHGETWTNGGDLTGYRSGGGLGASRRRGRGRPDGQ